MPKKNKENNADKSCLSVPLSWYPGHMAKTKRLIKENLKLIDIIYEVIDSRIPYSSKIQDINDLIKDKPRILIMTKYDLCDKDETNKFIDYYEKQGYHVLKYDLINTNNVDEIFSLSKKLLNQKIKKREEQGIKNTSIKAMVIGIPNVGKSTLINKVAGRKKVNVGNTPGLTKTLSWIRVDSNIELMDTPGILWPKLDQEKVAYNLASTTAIKEEILNKEDIAIYIINTLNRYYKDKLKSFYGIDDISDMLEVFDIIGKKKGCLSKGGIIDYDKVIDIIVNDIKSGRLKEITFDRFCDVK